MKIERREGVKKVGNEEGQNNYGSKIRDRRKRKRWEEDGIKKKCGTERKEGHTENGKDRGRGRRRGSDLIRGTSRAVSHASLPVTFRTLMLDHLIICCQNLHLPHLIKITSILGC